MAGSGLPEFLDFAGAYEGAETYKLQTNYRSTPEILETANAVIAGNPEQFQKELRAVRPGGEAPRLARMRMVRRRLGLLLRRYADWYGTGLQRRSAVYYIDLIFMRWSFRWS